MTKPLAIPMMPSPSHSSSTNRRTSRRKGFRRPCELSLGEVAGARRVTTWDLGLDGMCLLSPKPVTPGSRCEARFELPGDGAPLKVRGRVVYSSYCGVDGFRIGVAFGTIEDEVAEAIRSFVES